MSDIKYNRIDEDLQQKIISNRESHWINPYAFKDEMAVRRNNDIDKANLWRPVFVRDVEKIMHLYCLSDIHMPVDCKISSIIEMVKPFGEIVENNNRSWIIGIMKRNRFIKGLDCIDKEFIDKQFEWIKQWRNMYDN